MPQVTKVSHATFLLTVLVLFALAVTLSAQEQGEGDTPVGIVNGDTLWLTAFSQELGRKTELNALAGSKTGSDIVEETWRTVVEDLLVHQEATKRGLTVSEGDVDSVLLTATPDYIRKSIVDDKGRFDKALLTGLVRNPDSTIRAMSKGRDRKATEASAQRMSQTITELKARVASEIERERVRSAIMSETVIDPQRINDRLDKWTRSVTADIIYLPCAAYSGTPAESELRAWYDQHSQQYESDRPLRRITYIAFELIPSSKDSAELLDGADRFVQSFNNAKSAADKQQIWSSVASSAQAGYASLHPDTTAHAPLLKVLKGAKPGAAVGPVMADDGIHVFLIDSVGRNGSVGANVLVIPFEPGRHVVDSVYQIVQQARQRLVAGTTMKDAADGFGKVVRQTPYVTADDKLFDSYSLVDAAFDVEYGKVMDVVDAGPEGFVVGMVTDTASGFLPYEAARERVVQEVMQFNACKAREKDAKKQRALVTPLEGGRMFISVKPDDAVVMRDARIDPSGLIGDQIIDPLAAEILANSDVGMTGPFLGDAGWYIASVTSAVDMDEQTLASYRAANVAVLEDGQREDHWQKWLVERRTSSDIVDRRWMFFRY